MKAKENSEKEYVSYFQSVITVGILTTAKSIKEAEEEARKRLLEKQLNYCFFEQTPFELSDTEVCKAELRKYRDGEGLAFRFNPDYKTKNVIAGRLQKHPDELTDEDYSRFVKESLEMGLKKE